MEEGVKKLRKQLALYAFAMVALFGANYLIFTNFHATTKYFSSLRDNAETISRINNVASTVKDAETGLRGYVITGNEAFLEPYHEAVDSIGARLRELRKDLANEPEQLIRLGTLDARAQARMRLLKKALRAFEERGKTAATELLSGGEELRAMRALRETVEEMELVEIVQKRRLNQGAFSASQKALIAFVAASIVIAALFAFVFISTYRLLRGQIIDKQTKSAQARLAEELVVETRNVSEICERALAFLAKKLDFEIGSFYIVEGSALKLKAAYGAKNGDFSKTISLGEGLLGEAVKNGEMKKIAVPEDFPKASSSLLEKSVKEALLIPIFHEGQALGALELGSFKAFKKEDLEFLEAVRENLGVSANSAVIREEIKKALREAENFAAQLQEQREELRTANEELEEKTEALSASKEKLQTQQEELRVINEELEEQAERLEVQKEEAEKTNERLRKARKESLEYARQAESASRYKSEFLANMSHELRTPLNSLLILSGLLKDNKEGNLSEKQIEFASTINRSGKDLLDLINDILDLAKVEAGKLGMEVREFLLDDIQIELEQLFAPIAKERNVEFVVENKLAGVEMTGDKKRTLQVVKNFLSNALKFTEKGKVKLSIERPTGERARQLGLQPQEAVTFSVSDTGIGIPKEKKESVFHAFHQIDGSLSRKYSGTGLGLTISKQLAAMLGGDISFESEVGKGSSFYFTLPRKQEKGEIAGQDVRGRAGENGAANFEKRMIDRPERKTGGLVESLKSERVGMGAPLLIVEDDINFAKILIEKAREFGFDPVHSSTAAKAFELLASQKPAGVLLDVELPDESGLTILKKLKANPATRNLPVHIISSHNFSPMVLGEGAAGFFEKPITEGEMEEVFKTIESIISKKVKRVLLVEDDAGQRESVCALLTSYSSVKCDFAVTGAQAREKLGEGSDYDCVILDLRLPDMSGYDLLKELESLKAPLPPIVVYTGQELDQKQEAKLRRFSDSIIVKGARSPERLLDEVGLFLHEVHEDSGVSQTHQDFVKSSEKLKNRKILLVDDDMRNIFSLTAALEGQGAEVSAAKNGQEALDALMKDPDQDAVLMDIMMPVMDGLEAIKKIRSELGLTDLPVIALTAKAMRADREESLAAGANDYMAKPVDVQKLVGLLKVWMSSKRKRRGG